MRGLLKAILDYPWQRTTRAKDRVYLNALTLLSAYGQELYLYTISKGSSYHLVVYFNYCLVLVDSNDSLYGGDKKFIGEISRIADTIINLLLEHLKELSSTEEVSADLADPVTALWLFCFQFSLYNKLSLNLLTFLRQSHDLCGQYFLSTTNFITVVSGSEESE